MAGITTRITLHVEVDDDDNAALRAITLEGPPLQWADIVALLDTATLRDPAPWHGPLDVLQPE